MVGAVPGLPRVEYFCRGTFGRIGACVSDFREKHSRGKSEPVSLSQVQTGEQNRILTGMCELDQVLGGGLVPGSLVLVGGDPGIGKSTLLLQVCRNLSQSLDQVLYISGEESLQQIKLRAARIGTFHDSLQLLCETNLTDIEEVMLRKKPRVAVIDSIQIGRAHV